MRKYDQFASSRPELNRSPGVSYLWYIVMAQHDLLKHIFKNRSENFENEKAALHFLMFQSFFVYLNHANCWVLYEDLQAIEIKRRKYQKIISLCMEFEHLKRLSIAWSMKHLRRNVITYTIHWMNYSSINYHRSKSIEKRGEDSFIWSWIYRQKVSQSSTRDVQLFESKLSTDIFNRNDRSEISEKFPRSRFCSQENLIATQI